MLSSTKIRSTTPTIDVYVKLAQYPVLCDQVRMRMREEMFRRGIVDPIDFEMEVKQLAQQSQRREGLNDPYGQEDEATWQKRIAIIRDLHTDNYFGNNLGPSLLEQLIQESLKNKQPLTQDPNLRFNPEIAPWAILFRQGLSYEALPPPKRELVQHHLEELKVVLIKRLISDNLHFIGIAKKVFSIRDLRWIYERLLGTGKIGGKAAGVLLALATLRQKGDVLGPDISRLVDIPETYFIGSEIIYEYIYINKLERFVNQKYLTNKEMREEYPQIVQAFLTGEFPSYIIDQLRDIVRRHDNLPYVVRSSSLLEDNFSYSFAGKYDSYFCFNSEDETENIESLMKAIRRIYASTFNPDAMVMRQEYGLIDYDERMAVMVQPLIGTKYGRYFWPTISGIGISCNPLGCEERDDGMLRLVWGYDKRTDTPFADAEATLVPLNKPSHNGNGRSKATVSPQPTVRVIDLEEKKFKQLPIEALLHPGCPYLAYISTELPASELDNHKPRFALTFDYFTRDPKFIKLMRTALMRLYNVFKTPVIFEFVVELTENASGVDYKLYILQCRPYLETAVMD
ncbi:MAG: hypothetical protein KC419_02145 [Anaerolineales bacterium]|nr:hypothetical protein [Anaerolineales bacterium]MCA9927243.1 hypothetical protein [Anaerolineales bacterium]